MKRQEFLRMFASEAEAIQDCRIRNRATQAAGNRRDLAVVVEGPSDDWTVMDVASAIDMGVLYSWYV